MGPNFRSIFPFVTFTLTSERDTTTYSSTFLSECDEGKWGWNCAMDCFCPVGDECHHIRGLCSSLRCLDGYRGSACQTRKLVHYCQHSSKSSNNRLYWRFCLSRVNDVIATKIDACVCCLCRSTCADNTTINHHAYTQQVDADVASVGLLHGHRRRASDPVRPAAVQSDGITAAIPT